MSIDYEFSYVFEFRALCLTAKEDGRHRKYPKWIMLSKHQILTTVLPPVTAVGSHDETP